MRTRLDELRSCLNVDGTKEQIARIEKQMAAPDFWSDSDSAQKVVQRLKGHKALVSGPEELQGEIEDAQILAEMAQEEADAAMGDEIGALVAGLEQRLAYGPVFG